MTGYAMWRTSSAIVHYPYQVYPMVKNSVNEPVAPGTWRPASARTRSRRFDFAKSIGIQARETDDLIEQLRAGLQMEAFHGLQSALHLSAGELAGVIGLPPRTLARRKKQGRLSPEESERLVRVARLLEVAAEVLGNIDDASRWMKERRPALGGRTPLERAETEVGAREVEDLLGRVAHGVIY
jgi:putative toxin-antitoxin system antitoxin component (TIGR02293 family)